MSVHHFIHVPSDVALFSPPCNCAECQHSFYQFPELFNPVFSYRRRISDAAAQRIAIKYVQDVRQDREYLSQQLEFHADAILNRWKKKSMDQRRTLLVNTIPELYEHRWLLARYANTPEARKWESRDKTRRSQLLLPWLSLEVLKTSPAVLFSLLHNRTVYTPQDWVPHDSRQLILSWAGGYFDNEYSSKCVVMYGPRYGDLVDWQADEIHRADTIGFPKARLILEAQAFLMGALRKIVDSILQTIDLNKPAASEKWRSLVSLGFKHFGANEVWPTYTNQAFSAPPDFDINRLLSIAQTRLDDASDHLWFLQTEPAHVRRYIRAAFQGELYRLIKSNSPNEACAMIVQEFMWDILSCLKWRWVRNECEYIKTLHDQFRDRIQPGKRLPLEYDRALGTLELYIVNLVTSYAEHLSRAIPYRPGFRQGWKFDHCRNGDGTSSVRVRRTATLDMKELFEKDPLEWCLSQMQGAPDKPMNFDHAMLFAFLENHLASSNMKERARVDDVLYRKLSDLAAFHEILVSVRLHRPRNKARDIDEAINSEDREAWKIKDVSISFEWKDASVLGLALLNDFYKAPLPSGLKNTTWLKRSKAIRKALEDFWEGLREHFQRDFEKSDLGTEEISNILKVISANDTPEYIKSV